MQGLIINYMYIKETFQYNIIEIKQIEQKWKKKKPKLYSKTQLVRGTFSKTKYYNRWLKIKLAF